MAARSGAPARLPGDGQKARLRFVGWQQWQEQAGEPNAWLTRDHIAHSPNCAITKATRLLDYQPRYDSLAAIREALEWLATQGEVPQPA